MADIELVIKIPERIHYGIEKGITVNGSQASQILIDAVKNGTPLPKGHWNDIRDNRVKDELNGVENELDSTTKNDLGVDAVSRKSVITIIQNHWWNCRDIDKLVNELPSVTPQEPVIRDNGIKNELNRVKNELEPTTKNDLAVDYIDRVELLKAMDTWDKFGNDTNEGLIPLRTPALQDRYVPYVHYYDMVNCVKGMPSVTSQLSSGLEKNSKKLEKNFDESDCISRADAIRVASGYCHPSNVAKELAKLPSVTIRPKGHWIDEGFYAEGHSEHAFMCSKCEGHYIGYVGDYKWCPYCGSRNEVEE